MSSAPPPTDLPVEQALPELRAALAAPGASAVLVAPPGAGKTTLVPLRLLEEPWLAGGRIVVLEPRRLATRAAARRMAALTGTEVGGLVGYRTRDERRSGPTTRVEVVTEGVLTRRLQQDPELPGVSLLVFDEVHERNLQTDLGLALALDARRHLRPDLRVLVMSATAEADKLAGLLGGPANPAPVVRTEGRQHPVEVRWVPPGPRDRLEDAAAAAVHRALRDEPGDVLVFLPGMAEQRRVADLLHRSASQPGNPLAVTDVRLLHGSLSAAEQDLALQPSPTGRRRVVLATDIAETSLTVEGVRVVVDSGLARAPRYDSRTGMTRLRTVPISRASAEQRAGRAGRTEPGAAYRLWSKVEHAGRRAHGDPEITQVDLAGLALEVAQWGGDPAALPFPDRPPAKAMAEATRLLTDLGALDPSGRPTTAGRAMAALPLHPRLARMVVDAPAPLGPLAVWLAIALDERDVLRGPPDQLPVDLAVRVAVLAGDTTHPAADRRALDALRARARDLGRRAGIDPDRLGPGHLEHAGRVLALAYPDRLAIRRGAPGRFQLRTGQTAWLPATDDLATASFVVAADLDGKRKDTRIRMAAALDATEVAEAFAAEVTERVELVWDGGDLVERAERRLGGLVLDTVSRRPRPGPTVVEQLLGRVRATRLAALGWGAESVARRHRLAFLHGTAGEPWPDVSDDALLRTVDLWLAPRLADATSVADLDAVDMGDVLWSLTDPRVAGDLDRLAPPRLALPTGRSVPIDYSGEQPSAAVRVQDLFGVTTHPSAGGRPVVLHLLSPADRPVQVTADLPGFWAGSWKEVRKEMAGRYPKHRWPEDPASAEPGR